MSGTMKMGYVVYVFTYKTTQQPYFRGSRVTTSWQWTSTTNAYCAV